MLQGYCMIFSFFGYIVYEFPTNGYATLRQRRINVDVTLLDFTLIELGLHFMIIYMYLCIKYE